MDTRPRITAMVLMALMFAAGGCSRNIKQIDNAALEKQYQHAPAWVLAGSKEDPISAVGSAPIGKGGLQFARTEAMGYARSEIARQVSVKVKSLVNNFSQQTGLGDEQSLDAFSRQVTKLVTDETLSGSRQKDLWISPNSEVYVLMILDKQMLEASVRRQIVHSYRQNSAQWQEFQAKHGNEVLDREIEEVFGESRR
jgi:hypothetical protein